MAHTDITLCNEALLSIHKPTITGTSGVLDATKANIEERVCATLFPNLKTNYLLVHEWTFNKRYANGTGSGLVVNASPAVTFDWFDYAYDLPTDYLGLRTIIDSTAGQDPEHEIIGLLLFSDAQEIEIFYSNTPSEWSYWPEWVVRGLVSYIAWEFSRALKCDKAIIDEAERAYLRGLATSINIDKRIERETYRDDYKNGVYSHNWGR